MTLELSPTLIVFPHRKAAHLAGFEHNLAPHHPLLRAWWPELGLARLHGSRPEVIIVSPDAILTREHTFFLEAILASAKHPMWIQL